jgi:uncharacterized integral membrane protein
MGVFRVLFYVTIGLVALWFAEANRGAVKVSLNPFPGADLAPDFAFEAPLFLIVFAAVATGVVLGAFSSWMRHVSVRRMAKTVRSDLAKAHSEIEKLRQQALSSLPSAKEKK